MPFEFKDGALHLKAPTGGEVRLRWQPVPEANMRLSNGRWHPYWPEIRLLAPLNPLPADMPETDKERLQAKYEAFMGFRAMLPDTLVSSVEPFSCHQWPMMTLLNRSISARELAQANPLLAYALANNEHLRTGAGPEVAATQATRYSRRKQREILGWLGFPDTEAMVRVFRKVPVSIVYPGLIRKLRQCSAFPEILKSFSHLPTLNTGVIFLTTHPDMASLVTPKLLLEIAESPDELLAAPTADLLHEIIKMAEAMRRTDRLRPLESYRKVQECRDGIAREYEAFLVERERERTVRAGQALADARERARGNRPATQQSGSARKSASEKFPPPPIPGTSTIIPLQSFAELKAESAEQSNCVGTTTSYAERVRAGLLYVYKVLAPERHTLSLVKFGSNCWTIGELKRHGNQMGTKNAYVMVRAWRDGNQLSL